MSVEARPTDVTTVDYLNLGIPFFEFGAANASGGFDPYRNLGIAANGELGKSIQLAQLRSQQSGTSRLVREFIREIEPQLNIGLYGHTPENMQLILGSSILTAVSGGTGTATDDQVQLTDDNQDFLDLANRNLVEPITGFSAAEIADEAVGTGQGGTFGETTGDFSLDYKPSVIGDVTAFSVGGTDRLADLVAGTTPAAGQIAISVGATATSGQITFPSGEAPAVGEALVATYEPSFALVENTDFVVDYKGGRIRLLQTIDGGTDAFKSFQPLEATYNYAVLDHSLIRPFTQLSFEGRMRVRLLTDVGHNQIWEIPNVSIRPTDDAFTFAQDDFGVTQLVVKLNDNGGAAPYGTIKVYPETP